MNAQAPAIGDRVTPIFVAPPTMWTAVLVAFLGLSIAFEPSLRTLLDVWFHSEDFSYGPILPFLCGFLIWQRRDVIEVGVGQHHAPDAPLRRERQRLRQGARIESRLAVDQKRRDPVARGRAPVGTEHTNGQRIPSGHRGPDCKRNGAGA